MSKPGYWLEVYETAIKFLLAEKLKPKEAHDKALKTVEGYEPERLDVLTDLIRE